MKPRRRAGRPLGIYRPFWAPVATGAGDLFRSWLDQIITCTMSWFSWLSGSNWDWLNGEIAPLHSDKGRPGMRMLQSLYNLSGEQIE